jgi:hypothetical protein
MVRVLPQTGRLRLKGVIDREKKGPSRMRCRGAWRLVEEESCPAPGRAAKPWGQGHLSAEPMLERDSDHF